MFDNPKGKGRKPLKKHFYLVEIGIAHARQARKHNMLRSLRNAHGYCE